MSKPAVAPNQAKRDVSLGIPGDSGAWIVDMIYGRLCGHILAWSERKQIAYICPMDVLLLDIAESLEATEVRLPNGAAIVTLTRTGEDNEAAVASGFEDWVDEMAENENIPQLVRPCDDEGLEHVTVEDISQAEKLSSTESREHFPSRMRTLARDMDKVHLQ